MIICVFVSFLQIREALTIFDKLFAEFELRYVYLGFYLNLPYELFSSCN